MNSIIDGSLEEREGHVHLVRRRSPVQDESHPHMERHRSRAPQQREYPAWLALIVLCSGMLMIILDQTIVNVALPSMQDDLGFSQSNLAWVVNAYLIAFGGLLLLAGRAGDLIGRKRVVPDRPRRLHRGIDGLRRREQPGDAHCGTLRAGRGRRDDLRGYPRHDRDAVPVAGGPGEGDRCLQLRRCRRRRNRPARRRHPHRSNQLALDLLRQPADRHRRGHCCLASPRMGRRSWSPGRSRRGRCGADHGFSHARCLYDRRGSGAGMGLPALAGPRRRLAAAALSLRGAPVDRITAPAGPAHLPVTDRHRRQPGAGADGLGHIRDVLPRRLFTCSACWATGR